MPEPIAHYIAAGPVPLMIPFYARRIHRLTHPMARGKLVVQVLIQRLGEFAWVNHPYEYPDPT